MKLNIFQKGDTKLYHKMVTVDDTARFETGEVHPVYATFALGRDAEWACRLFVLDIKEEDEEGIGTFITVEHLSPAAIGEEVKIVATLESVFKNQVMCNYIAYVGDRLIARGHQGQKILKKDKLKAIFDSLY